MGKENPEDNSPHNSSLSYTLDDLESFVEINTHSGKEDFWEPLELPGGSLFNLKLAGQTRYLAHLRFLKQYFQYTGGMVVRSCNSFPSESGLASSASSFAALTLAACRALSELTGKAEPSATEMANLSRHASGSSCRSFFYPWALWSKKGVSSIDLPYPKLIHHAIVISHDPKVVLSSEAHQRVLTSPHYAQRPARAEEHLTQLIAALTQQDWPTAFRIVWADFQDMHQLFASSSPPFQYINEQSQQVLDYFEYYWHQHGDGPLVTMDAGPNVHLLFRPDQSDLAQQIKQKFIRDYDVI